VIRFLLIAFAVAVMLCVAINVITGVDVYRWEAGAFAAFFVTFLPWPDIAMPKTTKKTTTTTAVA
jgi:hypothetical protein